jgi:hypothetical protein
MTENIQGEKTMKTAGRQAKKADIVDVIDPKLDQPKINGAMALMRADATDVVLVQAQHDSHVRAVALQLGYQLPADCTDPDLIQRDISANMRRSVEACLEVGRGLGVLKAACQHGNFMARLDVLGIEVTVAQRFMQASAKFSKTATSRLLGAAGNQSKLFEMLVLDDDQIEELELTGQTGELKLDDIASMSVKELRAGLREARKEKLSDDHLAANLNKRNQKLETSLFRIQKESTDERLLGLRKEATAIMNDALGAVRGGMRQALVALRDHPGEEASSLFMAGLVGQVQYDLTALREEFGLPDVSTAADAQLIAEMAQWTKDK